LLKGTVIGILGMGGLEYWVRSVGREMEKLLLWPRAIEERELCAA
jgi:hypothetical protein